MLRDLFALAAVVTLTCSVSRVALAQNYGNFETPDTPSSMTFTSPVVLLGWEPSGPLELIDAVGNGQLLGPAYEGEQYLDLNGNSAEYSDVPWQDPGTYTFSFAYANNYNDPAPASLTVKIVQYWPVVTEILPPTVVAHSSSGANDLKWSLFSTQVALNASTSTRVQFISNPGSGGMLIDDVRFTIPEPASLALLALAGGVLLVRRRAASPAALHHPRRAVKSLAVLVAPLLMGLVMAAEARAADPYVWGLNPDFESPDVATSLTLEPGVYVGGAGWWTESGSAILVDAAGNGSIEGAAYEGQQYLNLNGSTALSLFQPFPEGFYYMTFAVANNYNDPSPATVTLSFDNEPYHRNYFVGPTTVTHTGSTAGNLNWTLYTTQAYLVTSAEPVRFTSAPGSGGLLIDGFTFSVPEPASLTAMSLLGVAALRRRRVS